VGLARIRATCDDARCRGAPEALESAGKACRLTHGQDPVALEVLAAAHAEAGQFDEARRVLGGALAVAERSGQKPLSGRLSAQMRLYEANKPLRKKSGLVSSPLGENGKKP
jgi:hypothetical protein